MTIYLASPCIESVTTLSLLFFSEWDRDYKGTPTFFETILADINCPVPVKEGHIQFCRSDYFCEYPEDNDFRGTWRALWEVKLQLKEPLKKCPSLECIFIESEAFDHRSIFMGTNPDDLTFCMVIADFSTQEKLLEAEKQIMLKNSLEMHLPLEIRHAIITEEIFQLIINLGLVEREFYENGALDARIIQKICKKQGGTCHYRDRF